MAPTAVCTECGIDQHRIDVGHQPLVDRVAALSALSVWNGVQRAMEWHVWRVPIVLGVMASASLLLFAAAVMASMITRHRSTATKLAAVALLSLLVIVTGIAIRSTAWAIAFTLDISVTHVDPGSYRLSRAGDVCRLRVDGRPALFHEWRPRRSALHYYAWVLAFTAANTVNQCQPGWCATIGFPFAWHSWSDAIFNDDSFRPMMNGIGAVLDLVAFVAVAPLIARAAPPSTGVSLRNGSSLR